MGEEGLCLCAPLLHLCSPARTRPPTVLREAHLSHVLDRRLCQQQDLAEEGFAGWGPAVPGRLSEPVPPQALTSPSSCCLRIAQSPVSVPHPGPVNSCWGGLCQAPKSMCVCGGVLFPEEGGATGKAQQEELGVAGAASAWALRVRPAQTQEDRGRAQDGMFVAGVRRVRLLCGQGVRTPGPGLC